MSILFLSKFLSRWNLRTFQSFTVKKHSEVLSILILYKSSDKFLLKMPTKNYLWYKSSLTKNHFYRCCIWVQMIRIYSITHFSRFFRDKLHEMNFLKFWSQAIYAYLTILRRVHQQNFLIIWDDNPEFSLTLQKISIGRVSQ